MRTFQNLFLIDDSSKTDRIIIAFIGFKYVLYAPIILYGSELINNNDLQWVYFDSAILRYAYCIEDAAILLLDELSESTIQLMIFDMIVDAFNENLIIIYEKLALYA